MTFDSPPRDAFVADSESRLAAGRNRLPAIGQSHDDKQTDDSTEMRL